MLEKQRSVMSLLLISVSLAMGLIFTAPLVLATDQSGEVKPEPTTFFALTRLRVRPPDDPLTVSVEILDCTGESLRATQVSFRPASPSQLQDFRDLAIELAARDITPQPLIWLVCEPECIRLGLPRFCTITANDGRSPGACPKLSCRDFVATKTEDQSANETSATTSFVTSVDDVSLLGSHRIVEFTAEGRQVAGDPIIE